MKIYRKAIVLPLLNILCMSVHAEEIFLSEIIVKSELQERDIQDSQTSAVIVSGDVLDQSTDSNLYDMVKRIPGITSIYGEKGFAIRGVSEDGAINITLDGVAVPSELASFFGPYSTWDLEQVEILRGAQSTQSGRNSIAGAVNIRTANPTFEPEFKMRLNKGSRNTTTVAIAYNQPLIKDVLAIRIAGETLQTDGWVTNPTLDDEQYDAREMKTGRIKLLYKPTEKFKAVLGYSISKNEGGEGIVNYASWPEHRYNTSNEKAYEGTKSRIATLDLSYQINDHWSIQSLTGKYLSTYTKKQDFDMTAQDNGWSGTNEDGSTVVQELKLHYDSSHIRSVLGVFYTKVNTDTGYSVYDVPGGSLDSALDPLNLRVQVTTTVEQKIDNKALFGELEYDFNKQWTIILGARYDIESINFRSKMSGRITDTGFAPPAYIPVLEDRINYDGERMTDYSAFLPKIGVIYHLNEEQSIGLNYQKGYRAGGSDINEFTQNTYSFDPEYTDTVELTFRSESIDKKTRIMLNMFYTKWKDMQVTVYRPGSVYDVFVDNSGASTLYGTELSISHYLNDDLNVFLTAAYVKTRFDKYVSLGEDYSGNAFTFAPELAVSVGGEYYLSENWLLSADVNYQSESYGHPSNVSTSKIAPYALVNAKIGYKEKDWSVFLYGRNLTNEIYATQYYLNDNAERNKLRTGEPRFLGLQINLNF